LPSTPNDQFDIFIGKNWQEFGGQNQDIYRESTFLKYQLN